MRMIRKSLLIPALYLLGAQAAHCEVFHGLNCVDGCAGMKAGYKWAQDQDAHDPYLCGGRGREFEQGCSAYVLEAGPALPPPKNNNSSSYSGTDDNPAGDGDSTSDQNRDNSGSGSQ